MTATVLPIPAQRPAADDRWQLVTAAQAGDPDAFGAIYRENYDTVYRYVLRRCYGNRDRAEDLTQDVFYRALRRIDSVSYQGREVGAWLVKIARNLVMDYYKSGRYRYEWPTDELIGADAADTSREGDPAGTVADYLTNLTLLAAVQQLTEDQRDVIVLRFLRGLDVAETARELGKKHTVVKSLQYRAVRTLARLLDGTGVGL